MRAEPGQGADLYLVDDDPSVRDALGLVFEQAGFRVSGFADGPGLLQALQHRSADILLVDVQLPGPSGLDVLRHLHARKFPGPIILMSGHADIPMAVEAIKAGATDIIEKPFNLDRLVAQITNALANHSRRRAERADPVAALGPEGASLLTPRERDVLQELVRGASNKEAGRSLGISPRTIEVHRARIMEKLGARNAADLVRVIYDEQRTGFS
ncbi:response regulator transcription factor [Phreatobacter aquaticus]|uniref:Response regulator transcription factor n=1 Tax=Phreatobacter aquaticus TaxID=2570229 RepID=A0A4D7QKZ8_9HYPH|nr:response regulator [Phreatobacter aquaticus]QCK86369.1 response regulator transcription factor [Phreatobacter aquaticus]